MCVCTYVCFNVTVVFKALSALTPKPRHIFGAKFLKCLGFKSGPSHSQWQVQIMFVSGKHSQRMHPAKVMPATVRA